MDGGSTIILKLSKKLFITYIQNKTGFRQDTKMKYNQ